MPRACGIFMSCRGFMKKKKFIKKKTVAIHNVLKKKNTKLNSQPD
jgi:hypothetical protein